MMDVAALCKSRTRKHSRKEGGNREQTHRVSSIFLAEQKLIRAPSESSGAASPYLPIQ